MQTHKPTNLAGDHWARPLVPFEKSKIRLHDLVRNNITIRAPTVLRSRETGGSNVHRCCRLLTLLTRCTPLRGLFDVVTRLFQDNITHRKASEYAFTSSRINQSRYGYRNINCRGP